MKISNDVIDAARRDLEQMNSPEFKRLLEGNRRLRMMRGLCLQVGCKENKDCATHDFLNKNGYEEVRE